MVRFKNRYVVCNVVCPQATKREKKIAAGFLQSLNGIKLKDLIMQTVEEIHGQFGAASLRPGFKGTKSLALNSNTTKMTLNKVASTRDRIGRRSISLVCRFRLVSPVSYVFQSWVELKAFK